MFKITNKISSKNLVIIFCTLWLSYFTTIYLGYNSSRKYILIALLMAIIARKNNLTLFLFILLSIISTLFMYSGDKYGPPNIGILASILETNFNETAEFVSMIPWKFLFIAIISLITIILFIKYRDKSKKSIITNIFIIISFLLIFKFSWYNRFLKEITNVYYKEYLPEKQKMEIDFNKKPTWKIISQKEKKYNTYVVIIGESVNKRYMSLYGYPLKTTPFLDSVKGTFLNGYISTAANTAPSLPRTLCITKNYEKISYNDNIVTLANKAGLKTYWVSNQGKLGVYDTSISKIAINCQETYFTKKWSYDMENIDDDKLLPKINQIISNSKNNSPKVIFIHLIGSHPNPCDRLHNEPIRFKTNNNKLIDCYLTTFYKTDNFIKEVYNYLKKSEDSFSLIYFADHGLTVTNTPPYVNHGNKTKEGYEVPFVILSSDDKERKIINKKISAFNFTDIFANWLGVETNLTINNFSIETSDSNNKIKVFNWEKVIDFNSLEDTPLILPKKI